MKVQEISYGYEKECEEVANLAYQALLEEVYTTVKPGLVDLYSNGAHQDMDVRLFEVSASTLRPYFSKMAFAGAHVIGPYEDIFREIRKWGKIAEQAMYGQTKGVNTHKGLIFSLGIFCAAYGLCLRQQRSISLENLIKEEQKLVRLTLEKEVAKLAGNKRGAGARGEALSGYRSVTEVAMPQMVRALALGKDWNRVKQETLFSLMAVVEDANILARCNRETLLEVRALALSLQGADMSKCKEVDRYFIQRNISPGGSADLLALTIFIHSIVC